MTTISSAAQSGVGLAVIAMGLACSSLGPGREPPSCTEDFTGFYEVVDATSSTEGCDDFEPAVRHKPFARIVRVPESSEQELQDCDSTDPSSCGTLKGNHRFGTQAGSSCAGLREQRMTVERPGSSVCVTYLSRAVVTREGGDLLIELTSHQHQVDGEVCGSDPGWVRGENLPPCDGAQRLVLRPL